MDFSNFQQDQIWYEVILYSVCMGWGKNESRLLHAYQKKMIRYLKNQGINSDLLSRYCLDRRPL